MTRRLVLSYLAVTLVVLVLLEVPLAIFFQQRELDRLTANVERDATVLATIYEEALEDQAPIDPKPFGVATIPRPKCQLQTRLTMTRAVSGLLSSAIQFASVVIERRGAFKSCETT